MSRTISVATFAVFLTVLSAHAFDADSASGLQMELHGTGDDFVTIRHLQNAPASEPFAIPSRESSISPLLGIRDGRCEQAANTQLTALTLSESSQPYRLKPVSELQNHQRSQQRCECDTVYASFSLGMSHIDGDSTGFGRLFIPDIGPLLFPNSGDSHDHDYLLGGAIGKRCPVCLFDRPMTLRVEAQGMDRHDMTFRTPSTGGRTYHVNVGDLWTVGGNLWLDIPVARDIEFYTGFGLGAAGFQAAVNDTVIAGTSRDTDFSYTIGTGFNFRLTDDIVLDLGWRFVDLGEADVPLSTIAGGVPAGEYELDLNSNEFLATVRIDLF